MLYRPRFEALVDELAAHPRVTSRGAGRPTDLASYLEFVIFTRGLVEARRTFYGGLAGPARPLATPAAFFSTQPRPSLDHFDGRYAPAQP